MGYLSEPKYENAQSIPHEKIMKLVKRLCNVTWSLYRIEWWRKIMSVVAKGNVHHVICSDFPRNVSSAKELFVNDDNFREYNNKIGQRIGLSKQGT